MSKQVWVCTRSGRSKADLIEANGQFAITDEPSDGIALTHLPTGLALFFDNRVDALRELLHLLSSVPVFDLQSSENYKESIREIVSQWKADHA